MGLEALVLSLHVNLAAAEAAGQAASTPSCTLPFRPQVGRALTTSGGNIAALSLLGQFVALEAFSVYLQWQEHTQDAEEEGDIRSRVAT